MTSYVILLHRVTVLAAVNLLLRLSDIGANACTEDEISLMKTRFCVIRTVFRENVTQLQRQMAFEGQTRSRFGKRLENRNKSVDSSQIRLDFLDNITFISILHLKVFLYI